MAGGGQIPVWIARAGDSILLRPEGPCTITICRTIDAGLRPLLDGGTADLYIDLSLAEWLDSTFTGYLVSLVTRDNKGRVHIHLVSPSEAALHSLDQMHVLDLFEVVDQLPAADTPWTETPHVADDPPLAADRVIDAHEHLIEADPRNAPVFEPVVKLFRSQKRSP